MRRTVLWGGECGYTYIYIYTYKTTKCTCYWPSGSRPTLILAQTRIDPCTLAQVFHSFHPSYAAGLLSVYDLTYKLHTLYTWGHSHITHKHKAISANESNSPLISEHETAKELAYKQQQRLWHLTHSKYLGASPWNCYICLKADSAQICSFSYVSKDLSTHCLQPCLDSDLYPVHAQFNMMHTLRWCSALH